MQQQEQQLQPKGQQQGGQPQNEQKKAFPADKDNIPPHEGVLKSGNESGVSIEQLFEDTYSVPSQSVSYHSPQNDPVTAPSLTSQDLGIKGCKALPASRVVAAQRRLAKLSIASHLSLSSSKPFGSSSVDPHVRKKASSIPSLPFTATSQKRGDVDGNSPARLASRSSRRTGSATSSNGGEVFTPVSGVEALKDHATRLTDREKAEVKVFKTVYYLGQLSAKKAAREEAEKNDGFDDKEGFYVCKPHDHLLYRYEICDLLGKGTFGQVVKALDHKTNSLVAMKIVKNERPFLRQAKEEVRILEILRKQDKNDLLNVVHILDSFKFRGHVCIAFELLGISLHQLLKKTRGQGFSLSRIQKLTRGILRCLDVLSKNRIIHCDIKPENILLRRSAPGTSASSGTGFSDGSIKVIDFGSSCYEQQQIYTYIQSRYYRAPEVILGARYSSAIDMWSLACVVGELLTSRPLFAGEDESDQLASIMEVHGLPPVTMMPRCKRWDKFFTGETPRYISNPSRRTRRGDPKSVSLSSALKDIEDTAFLDFMQKALTWDPASRLTASDALQHPWIMRGQVSKTSVTDSKAAPSSGLADHLKTKIPNTSSHLETVHNCRQASGNKTDATRGISTSCSSHTNSLTAKLPSHLSRPQSDSTRLEAKARAGPCVALPPWDAR